MRAHEHLDLMLKSEFGRVVGEDQVRRDSYNLTDLIDEIRDMQASMDKAPETDVRIGLNIRAVHDLEASYGVPLTGFN